MKDASVLDIITENPQGVDFKLCASQEVPYEDGWIRTGSVKGDGSVYWARPRSLDPAPLYTIMVFSHRDEAERYRKAERVGGWIFGDEEGEAYIFPITHFTPTQIVAHPLTQGKSGRIF